MQKHMNEDRVENVPASQTRLQLRCPSRPKTCGGRGTAHGWAGQQASQDTAAHRTLSVRPRGRDCAARRGRRALGVRRR